MGLFVITRHAESALNVQRIVSGNPGQLVELTEDGREQARLLAVQVAHVPLDLCLHTRFDRTRRTAELMLAGRDVPVDVEPLLDDVDVGELDGLPMDEYRAWKRGHTRSDRFPGGESLDEAAHRYARGYRALLARSGRAVLVICHEIPLRYALNAAADSDSLDGPVHDVPNARPFLFDEQALERAAARIEALSS